MRWLKRLKHGSDTPLQHGEEIALENCDIPVKFRRHPKARRLTLRLSVTNRQAIVTVPPCCSDQETLSFLDQNISWLYKQYEKLPAPVPFTHNQKIPLRGETHMIEFQGPVRGKGVVWFERSVETSDIPKIKVAGNEQFAPRRLKSWLLNEARKDLSERSLYHAGNLGLKFKKIMIRDQCTRWGSCSSAGVLSYSWRLILSPVEVLDYVAAHEVAHLREMNHGPGFWSLVRETLPGYEKPKQWLRDHGTTLHRYDLDS